MKITDIIYGKSVLSESMIFQNGAEDKFRPILFKIFLIETDAKKILVDAGCETMPGFEMKDFCGPVRALEKLGVSAGEITDVVITHAHHDHAECVSRFKNARVYIQKDEYPCAKQYIPDTMQVITFDDEYELCPDILIKKIGGHSVGSCVVIADYDNKKTVFAGDECYMRECLDKKIPTGASCCPEKSKYFIDEFAKPQYDVRLCHDI